MARVLETQFDFLANYELIQLERIDRSGGKPVYSYPGAHPLDRQQELADGPILEVRPGRGDPWVGVFDKPEWGAGLAMPGRIFGWPDGWSICVVYAGAGVVVRADDPTETYEIAPYPLTGAAVFTDLELVVFTDTVSAAGYGASGLVWRTEQLASDDVRIERIEGHDVHVSGYTGRPVEGVIDAATGALRGDSYDLHPTR